MLSAAGTDTPDKGEDAARSARRLSPSGKPLDVLVVEDDALTAVDLSLIVEDAGGRAVATASSAGEAEALARALKPDVVLMDVRLAGARDGVDAAHSIRQFSDVPIVFVTANIDGSTIERIRQFNGSVPVAKPVDTASLMDAVLAAVERRRP